MENDIFESSDKPALTLIQQLKDGLISAATLTKNERLCCVEALILEGYTPSQIAQHLGRSEKTIKRDWADIRQRHSQNPSPDHARQLIGSFLMKIEAHQTRLMRLSRGTEGSVSDRARAEFFSWAVLKQSMELLQSLGYLPDRPKKFVGEFMHHVNVGDSESPLEDVDKTIREIIAVGEETQTLTPELAARIDVLRRRLEKAKLSQEAQRLLEDQQQLLQKKEDSNEESR